MEKDLCDSCQKLAQCAAKGIVSREHCNEYEPLPLEEELARDEFIKMIMIGPCPKCGSENTGDCENTPPINDNTIGHCTDCETYWCTLCDYVFKTSQKGDYLKDKLTCPHEQFCRACAAQKGYLDFDEFLGKICPTCEHYSNKGCQLDPDTECMRQYGKRCPYEIDLSDCPALVKYLKNIN